MKIAINILSVASLAFAVSAHAGSDYYVYKKGNSSDCEISQKSPEKFNKGSQWQYLGKDSTRSGAKKKGEAIGCTSF